jgi:hypothetical protein
MVGSHAIPRASGTGDASLEMPGLRVSVARSRRVARGLCPLPLVFFSSIAWRAKIKTEREAMNGIQFVTDEKGRKVAVQIDLKKYGAIWEDFWDGLISESRRKEKGIPYEEYRANRLKRRRSRG